MTPYIYLIAVIGLTAISQLTLKYAATRPYEGIRRLLNPYNFCAWSLLLLVTMLFVKTLQYIPLGVVAAWMSLTYLLVVLLSVWLFREGGLWRKLAGCLLICAGVLVIELPVA